MSSKRYTRKQRRRRGTVSNWVDVLEESRTTKKARCDSGDLIDCSASNSHHTHYPEIRTGDISNLEHVDEMSTLEHAESVQRLETHTSHPTVRQSHKANVPQTLAALSLGVKDSKDIAGYLSDESFVHPSPRFQEFHSDDLLPNENPPRNTSLLENNENFEEEYGTMPGTVTVRMDMESESPIQTSVDDTTTAENHGNVKTHDEKQNPRNANIALLKAALHMWENRSTLAAIISIVGSVRFTVHQYNFMKDILKDKTGREELPPYQRMHQYFQKLLDTSFPHSEIVRLPRKRSSLQGTEDGCENQYTMDTELENGGRFAGSCTSRIDDTEKVRIFLPSSWAKTDVSTSTVFGLMYPSFEPDSNTITGHQLEGSKIILERESVTNACAYIFARNGGNTTRCSCGSVVEVSVSTSIPDSQSGFTIRTSGNAYMFKGRISAVWCVGGPEGPTKSYKEAMMNNLPANQSSLMTCLSTSKIKNPKNETENGRGSKELLAGDICALLVPERLTEGRYLPVVIYRFWRHEEGVSSISLGWYSSSQKTNSEDDQSSWAHQIVALQDVEEVKFISKRVRAPPPSTSSRPHGKLSDGTPYVVYRILLYADDFQKSSMANSKGSAGGCYFIPLSLPPEGRRTTSAIRIISLTPPGVSTNEVLHYVTDDLVNASVNGVVGYTPAGTLVRIFIDVVGFIGDYPAAAGTIDTIGHTGRAPCTVCSFRRLQDIEAEGSRYGYSTIIHSSNSTFLRHEERHAALRECSLPYEDAIRLGMQHSEKTSERSSPLLYLQRMLHSQRHRIPLTDDGLKVHSGLFDAYRCNVVAPDHLLTGLAKNALNVFFRCLPTEKERLHSDIRICAALQDNGLLIQRQIYNRKNGKLHTMSLSELFCVLLVSVPVSKTITSSLPANEIVKEAEELLTKLQELVGYTYWWPIREVDGEEAQQLVQSKKDDYIAQLQSLSKSYVRKVDYVCKRFPELKRELDKPNLHRLIELYELSIPSFGHAREFMELVFEATHQPLKRCISRSNNRESHIFAVEHSVANDWQGRLSLLYNLITNSDERNQEIGRLGLRRMLLGPEADLLDRVRDKEFTAEIDSILEKQLRPSVLRQFERDERVANFNVTKFSMWTARNNVTVAGLSESLGLDMRTMNTTVEQAVQWIDATYPRLDGDEHRGKAVKLFRGAKRVRVSLSGRQVGRPHKFDAIEGNCVIQAYLDENGTGHKLLYPSCGTRSSLRFFAVVGVLQRQGDPAWAICLGCKVTGKRIRVKEILTPRSFQIVQLNLTVRRVAVFHACEMEDSSTNPCVVNERNRFVQHSCTVLGQGSYRFQRRVNGYPPRVA